MSEDEGKIFVGQTRLRITIETQADLTDADAFYIKYEKPDGTEGQWVAVCDDLPKGEIYKDDFIVTDLDLRGIWTFWASIEWQDSSGGTDEAAPGEAFTEMIYDEGE
jgi:hypothetical protein